MSDIKKTLDKLTQLNENVAGAVASVAMPLEGTQKRVQEGPETAPEVSSPADFGLWQNSALAGKAKKLKGLKTTGVVKESAQSKTDPNMRAYMTLKAIEKKVHAQGLKGAQALEFMQVSLLDAALNVVGRGKRAGYEPHVLNVKNWKDAEEFLRTAYRDGVEQGVAEAAKWRDPKYKDQLYTQEPGDSDEYDSIDYGYETPERPEDDPGQKRRMGGVKDEFPSSDPLAHGHGIGRSGIKNNLNTHGARKGMPSRDQVTSLKGSIKDAHGRHTRPNLPESGPHDRDFVEKSERHERLRALAKRMGDKEKFDFHNAEIEKLYGQKSPPHAGNTFNEEEMSRAAKGNEKYGKNGMQALAKAGREGRDLDKIRDKYDRYDESVTEDEQQLNIGQQMARDGIVYSPDKENEIIGMMAEYMRKDGYSSKQIRYYMNSEDYIPDMLSELPRAEVTEGDYNNKDAYQRDYDNSQQGFTRPSNHRDSERHDLDVPTPQVWGLKINGKVWSKSGKDVTFNTKQAALNTRNAILKNRPDLDIGLVTQGGMAEGYQVTRGIDKERYQARHGLEGPFSAKNGKVVYYDKVEGKYYDPDSDMYISHDDWQDMNEALSGNNTQGSGMLEGFGTKIKQLAKGLTGKKSTGSSGRDSDNDRASHEQSMRARAAHDAAMSRHSSSSNSMMWREGGVQEGSLADMRAEFAKDKPMTPNYNQSKPQNLGSFGGAMPKQQRFNTPNQAGHAAWAQSQRRVSEGEINEEMMAKKLANELALFKKGSRQNKELSRAPKPKEIQAPKQKGTNAVGKS